MKKALNFILLLGTMTAVGCRAVYVEIEPPTLKKEQVWKLVEIQGRKVERRAAPVTIVFNPENGSLRGQAACNGYNADYKLESRRVDAKTSSDWCALSVGDISHTAVQCPDAEMNAEARYLARLAKCTQLALADAGNTLMLGHKDKPVLVFELQQ